MSTRQAEASRSRPGIYREDQNTLQSDPASRAVGSGQYSTLYWNLVKQEDEILASVHAHSVWCQSEHRRGDEDSENRRGDLDRKQPDYRC